MAVEPHLPAFLGDVVWIRNAGTLPIEFGISNVIRFTGPTYTRCAGF